MEIFRRFGEFSVEPLSKGQSAADAAPSPDGLGLTAKIGGVISDESSDIDEEIVVQDGVDWSYFQSDGWFNYDHQKGPGNLVGYPDKVIRDGATTRVEGHLLLDRPHARDLYDLAQSLEKSNSPRRLKFSVEGRVLERDPENPKRITKSQVLYVAITPTPVNTSTNMELIKSLAAACDNGETLRKSEGATVGYQTPASGGGSLGALVPQSISNQISSATYKAKLLEMFPRLADDEAERLVKTLWGV